MAKNTGAMQEVRRKSAEEAERNVLAVIEEMRKNGENVTFYGVAKRSGSSRSFLHNNERICDAIRGGKEEKQPRSKESNAALLKAAMMKIKALEAENAALKKMNEDTYKVKYERLLKENEMLQEQLKTAYKY